MTNQVLFDNFNDALIAAHRQSRMDRMHLEHDACSYPSCSNARMCGARIPISFAIMDFPGNREEICLGVGAHTHYFDWRFDRVAEELDQLIVEAAATH